MAKDKKKQQTSSVTMEKPVMEEDQEKVLSLVDYKNRLAFDTTGPHDNWLWNLPVGTFFYAEAKNPADYVAQEYYIIDKTQGVVVVEYRTAKGDILEIPLLSNRFCNQHNLKHIRGVVDLNEGHR